LIYRALAEDDVESLLPRLSAPTLVIQHDGLRDWTVEMGRNLAAGIKGARLLVVKGTWYDNADAVLDAIDEFLGEGAEAQTKTELPEGMAVLLFADIVESTALTEQLGDTAFRAKAHELDSSLRSIIREGSGTPVEGKVLGDGVLAVFTSARQAIECALRCNAASEPVGLQLHLGIHAGDVIREGNNVYGGAVNIAARIAGASAPGEVLVSDTVRGLARPSAGVAFDDRGERSLKGVADPQRLFVVREGSA
jgi:class 3 adenylate cyclase